MVASNIPQVGDKWYRYADITYGAPLDEWENPIGQPRTEMVQTCFLVDKVTPMGVWLVHDSFPSSYRRFCLAGSRRQFACPTIALALESYIARKAKQLSIFEMRAATVRELLARAYKMAGKEVPNSLTINLPDSCFGHSL